MDVPVYRQFFENGVGNQQDWKVWRSFGAKITEHKEKDKDSLEVFERYPRKNPQPVC